LPPLRALTEPGQLIVSLLVKLGPVDMYDQLAAEGKVNSDDHQRAIIAQLQRIWNDLKAYHPNIKATSSSEEQHQHQGGWMSKVNDLYIAFHFN
jgi:predicted ATPase